MIATRLSRKQAVIRSGLPGGWPSSGYSATDAITGHKVEIAATAQPFKAQ
jgi:hypothetical protein